MGGSADLPEGTGTSYPFVLGPMALDGHADGPIYW
jgi:hypothetical protein